MARIVTLTLDEARVRLRDAGLGMDAHTIADGIEQGVFPFGLCIRTERGRVFKIFARQLKEWIDARAME